jgi:hypothetical protein
MVLAKMNENMMGENSLIPIRLLLLLVSYKYNFNTV